MKEPNNFNKHDPISRARKLFDYSILGTAALCSVAFSEPVLAKKPSEIRYSDLKIQKTKEPKKKRSKVFKMELDSDSLEMKIMGNMYDGSTIIVTNKKKKKSHYSIIAKDAQSRIYADKIVRSIDSLIESGATERNCWRWADLVYRDAGIDRDERVILYDKHKYMGIKKLNKEQLSRLETGDWLYIHNRNTNDRYGNHSLIFISWVDKDKQKALVAQNIGRKPSGEWRKGNYGISDFKKNPVVFWSRAKYK